jgi:lactate dehydrogenase-like 2-hydroxyacid dehydrogenase
VHRRDSPQNGDMTVLQVGKLQPAFASMLASQYNAIRMPDRVQRAAFLAEHGPEITVVVDGGTVPIDAELMAALPNLGAIVHYGAGYDSVDVESARRLGIGVSNTPDVLTDTVADTAVGLLLATVRRLCAADRYVREGRWVSQGAFPLTTDVSGSKVGILGLGRIGSAIASRLEPFRCEIFYHNRHEIEGCAYRYASSAQRLAEAVDVMVVATTGGKGTESLVDRTVMEALGRHGYLINMARGSVIDQPALIDLLQSGRLAGAGLDVFADEPNVPQVLAEMDNVVLLPHIGSATTTARDAMAQLALRNLNQYLSNGTLATPVIAAAK